MSIKNLQHSLQDAHMLKGQGIMDTVITTLCGVVKHTQELPDDEKAKLILGEVLSDRCLPFHFQLKQYIQKLGRQALGSAKPTVERLMSISDLFRGMLVALPSLAWSVLPLDEMEEIAREWPNIESSSETGALVGELKEAVKLLLVQREGAQSCSKWGLKELETVEQEWDNSEYRDIQILPRWEEVCDSKPPSRLRENITCGGYNDWLHYYDVQFRLLREDFVAPLRKGVNDYRKGLRGRKLQNIRAYKDVYIEKACLDFGTCYGLKLDVSRMRCNWEHSDRLKYGTLLLLSPDDFKETAYFAIVSKREIRRNCVPGDKLPGENQSKQNLMLSVQFPHENASTILRFSCTKMPFTMIESCAYFEASRHILRSLQSAETFSMPFTNYLIKCQWETVEQPLYLYGMFSKSNFQDSEYFRDSGRKSDRKSRRVGSRESGRAGSRESGRAGSRESHRAGSRESRRAGSRESHRAGSRESRRAGSRESRRAGSRESRRVGTRKSARLESRLKPNDSSTEPDSGLTRSHEGSPESAILHSDEEGPDTKSEESLIVSIYLDIISFSEKPSNELSSLDESQLKAIEMALTQEVALIQGPPGTGKTYIGLKIVEMLLCMKPSSPILILCFTNHALDQFLEGILDCSYYKNRSPRLVRVGSRSQSERVSEFNIKKVRKKTYLPMHVRRAAGGTFKNAKVKEQALSEKLDDYFEAKDQRRILPRREIYRFMDPKHESSLLRYLYTQEQFDCALEIWLQLVAVPHLTMLPIPLANSAVKDERLSVGLQSTGEQFSQYHGLSDEVCPLDDRQRVARMKLGFSYEPMTKEEAESVDDIHDLDFEKRWRLYMCWHSLYLNDILSRHEFEQEFADYSVLCTEKERARRSSDRYVLETAQIIGMTTTGAANYQEILKQVKPAVVIVEEAAEVLESHIVSALSAGTQHLILIGDHKQLRPKPNDYRLEKEYGLDVSLFERLILNNFPHATMTIQHRMRPEIARLVKPHIYNELHNHASVESYPDVKGVSTNLFFIQHEKEEAEDENLISHSNSHEDKYLVSLCQYLLQQGYTPKQITILVTYTGQLLQIRRLIRDGVASDVRVSTVDNYQGEENDIILLSVVRSNSKNIVGFLKEENRVCVTLSRARHGLYCIGNFKMLRDSVPLWESILSDVEETGKIGEGLLLHCNNHPEVTFTAVEPGDFAKNSPNGGCRSQCNFRLGCGHVCEKQCHNTDPNHAEYVCRKRCSRRCPEGHLCAKPCSETCDECKVKVTKSMPKCGHEQEMFCHQKPEEVPCKNPCKTNCSRDLHPCPLKCHQVCRPCVVKSLVVLPECQHEQMIKCHEDPESFLCLADCSHSCEQGHKCPKRCHEPCGLCQVQVEKVFPDCNHKAFVPCSVTPRHSDCPQPCEEILPCEHVCALRCGVDCSSQECEVKVTVELPGCKHLFTGPCHVTKDLSSIICGENCGRNLSCSHLCSKKCGEQCDEECTRTVKSVLPCKHQFTGPCHMTKKLSTIKCDYQCKKKMSCGHLCSKKCGEDCDDKCMRTVQKKYLCGHEMRVPCYSTPSDYPCKLICSCTLACGHHCTGKCSECSLRRIHRPCQFRINMKQYCGHSAVVYCADLFESRPCSESLPLQCTHGDIRRECSRERFYDYTCNERCTWSCPHYRCDRRCSEDCSRPWCDQPCTSMLECGHRCYGLCGEPCIYVCPECQSRDFNSKLKYAGRFDKKKRYFKLICGHIFTVEYLDSYTQKASKNQLIAPLLCPVNGCSRPFSLSFRYGNAMKKSLRDVEIVSRRIHESRMQTPFQDSMATMLVADSTISNSGIYQALNRLKDSNHVTKYTKLIIVVISGVIQMMELTQTELSDSDDIKNFLEYFTDVNPPKVTYQTVIDTRSEFLRLSLSFQCQVVSASSDSANSVKPIKGLLYTLSQSPNTMRVSIAEYERHSKAVKKACKECSALDAIQKISDEVIRSDIHLEICSVQWWRCTLHEEHCFSSPPSLPEMPIKLDCPECKGSYHDYIHLPLQLKAHTAMKSKAKKSSPQKPATPYLRVTITGPDAPAQTMRRIQYEATGVTASKPPPARKPTQRKKVIATSSVHEAAEDPLKSKADNEHPRLKRGVFSRLSPIKDPPLSSPMKGKPQPPARKPTQMKEAVTTSSVHEAAAEDPFERKADNKRPRLKRGVFSRLSPIKDPLPPPLPPPMEGPLPPPLPPPMEGPLPPPLPPPMEDPYTQPPSQWEDEAHYSGEQDHWFPTATRWRRGRGYS